MRHLQTLTNVARTLAAVTPTLTALTRRAVTSVAAARASLATATTASVSHFRRVTSFDFVYMYVYMCDSSHIDIRRDVRH